jgi:hypothetical protein
LLAVVVGQEAPKVLLYVLGPGNAFADICGRVFVFPAAVSARIIFRLSVQGVQLSQPDWLVRSARWPEAGAYGIAGATSCGAF